MIVDDVKQFFRRHVRPSSPGSISREPPALNGPGAHRAAASLTTACKHVPTSLRLFLIVATPILVLYLVSYCGWYNTAPKTQPLYGVNFSCKRAEFLGQPCAELFRSVLTDLGVRQVRISVYWSDVEQQPGIYDFHAVDELLDAAALHGARVSVSIGMKAQRYPEFWFPTWLRLAAALPVDGYPEESPLVQAALFPYLEAVTRHVSAHPAVEAIQVENEPFVHTQGRWRYANGWRITREFLAREIDVVREADGGRHPILVSHASWQRKDQSWRWIVEHADVVAQSVYTKRQRGPWPWLYIFPYRIGPFAPNLPNQARAAEREGRELWIGELQAEPFEMPSVDIRRISTSQAGSFSARWLRANLEIAGRSGATRAYLWGVEWWAYLKLVRGEPELWDAAKQLFGRGASGSAGAP